MNPQKLVFWQTAVVAAGEVLGVGAMLGIFALLGKFDNTVLLGGIVGGVMTILNFFIMAIAVNIAADKAKAQNVSGAKGIIKLSYFGRLVLLAVVLFAFLKSGLCNPIALVVPLIFSRITLTFWEFFRRRPGDGSV